MRLLRRSLRRSGRLRVLFVVPDLGVGGAERHAATLAPALDPTRFDVSLVCIGEEGALFPGLVDAGIPARALHLRDDPPRALWQLVRLMLRLRPDVVVTRGYNAETLGRVAAALTRVPRSVVWVHNCGDVTPRGRLRAVVDRVLDRVTSAYYAVAEGQRPYLVDDLGYPDAKIEVIHNGVDVDRFVVREPGASDSGVAAEFGFDKGAPVIGAVAVLRPEKDHATLLHAMRLVLDERPDARLLIVGDGPERSSLEALATELGIAGSVAFAGARHDVDRLLGGIDVVTLSSFTVECFPMAILEAMARGLPAVATAVGGVPEMIDDGRTGHVVPPRDPRALADALLKVIGDPSVRASMGAAGRRRVEELFTLERSVCTAEAALERTTGRSTAAPVRVTVLLDTTFVGGVEKLTLDLLRRLDPATFSPRVLCLREEGPLAADFRAAGIPLDVLPRSGRYDLSTVPRLVRTFRTERTDVVLVTHHHRAALTLGRVAARLAGIANLVAAHDMDLTTVGGRVLPRRDVESLFLSDALVLLAPSQGRYLRDREGVGSRPWRRAREVVIPNGVVVPPAPSPANRTTARARLGLDDGDEVLGIVARLSPQKAHEVLVRAVARLAPYHPRLRLVIIGEGERETALRALVDELGLAEQVRFTGVLHDVRDLLPGLDVSCLSSVHEGVPLTVLESMAAGVPVVATRCGALSDLVTEGRDGFLVPVGDDRALADRLGTLLAEPGLRRAMGARARERAVQDFSIDRTVRGYQDLLTEVVGR
ncbi:glycosyltransferase [Pseudonocardia kujensis]|uniref:glycosyltransferase n=1 Tax=Pseudonocardia kujensis TaxID=1128675 RepID=UPI001E489087|nr:glycosyltransferase [Pseudonocardia kujensis]MCE0763117.1 glycosyltransferase [Pseudonocardia kujensis]